MSDFGKQYVYNPHKTLPCRPIGRKDVEMMGLIGAGNNPMVGMTVAVAVAVEEAMNK